MKKLLVIISLVAGTALVHAQGIIDLTGTSAAISTNSGSFVLGGGEVSGPAAKTPGQAAAPLAYYYALLFDATAITGSSTPTNSEWSQVTAFGGGALTITNSILAGSLQGNSAGSGQAVNLASATPYNVELVGWSATLGTQWSTVLTELTGNNGAGNWAANGFFGYTAEGTVTPGSAVGGGGDPTIFTSIFANGSLTLYAVTPTPEPTTLALAGLGGLSMLLIRRRKS
jgi:hypothetical protein